MKFVFADSLDFVDPAYDFIADRNGVGRTIHHDDQFPHDHVQGEHDHHAARHHVKDFA